MTRESIRKREGRRAATAARFKDKRTELVEVIKNRKGEFSFEEMQEAQRKISKLPRDASDTRQRRRCFMCGRPRGITPFGLCRIHLRENAMQGKVPGIKKSSW